MKKLTLFLISYNALFALNLQSLYEAKPQIWTLGWIALAIVCSGIFAIVLLVFKATKPRKTRDMGVAKKIVQKTFDLRKIEHKDYNISVSQNDIAKWTILYFGILHIKATRYLNKFMFDLDPKIGRFYTTDFINLAYAVFGICDFLVEAMKSSKVVISITQSEIGLKFSIKVFSIPSDESRIKDAIAGKKGTIIYKPLKEAAEYAKLLHSQVVYSSSNSSCEFTLNVTATPVLTQYNLKFNPPSDAPNAVIKTDDKIEFEILQKQLKFFGISVDHGCDSVLADRLINDAIFRPDFVFIDAEFIRLMSGTSMNMLVKNQKIKGFSLIILSKNEGLDEEIKAINTEVFLLRQPYIIDELLAILNHKAAKNTDSLPDIDLLS